SPSLDLCLKDFCFPCKSSLGDRPVLSRAVAPPFRRPRRRRRPRPRPRRRPRGRRRRRWYTAGSWRRCARRWSACAAARIATAAVAAAPAPAARTTTATPTRTATATPTRTATATPAAALWGRAARAPVTGRAHHHHRQSPTITTRPRP
ncbi:Protein of unknown function, partial [Gryllus bimaculatus]